MSLRQRAADGLAAPSFLCTDSEVDYRAWRAANVTQAGLFLTGQGAQIPSADAALSGRLRDRKPSRPVRTSPVQLRTARLQRRRYRRGKTVRQPWEGSVPTM